jgi:3-phenylpropionate/trans-cinnamate dioxygenase ferredoxin component
VAEYVAIGGEDDIDEGTIRDYVVNGRQIAVARCEGTLYAIDAICSHAHAYLSEGEIDTDFCVVECPLHGARFSLATGKVRALPATEPIQTFPLRVTDGIIEVAIGDA